MQLIKRISLALLCLTALSEVASGSVFVREVHLKKKAEVWSQDVCLDQLVKESWVRSRCSVDRKMCCRWSMENKLKLKLSLNDVEKEIKKMDFGSVSIKLLGSDIVNIEQTHRRLSGSEIKEKIITSVSNRIGKKSENVKIKGFKLRSAVYVPMSKDAHEAWDVVFAGPIVPSCSVKIISPKNAGKTLGWANVTLAVESEVYVAKKNIKPHATLKAEDFELKKVDVFSVRNANQKVFSKGMFPGGMRAKLSILKNKPLLSGAVERIPSVGLGDVVTLILRSDNLKISTKGVAQGSAAIGDTITVQLRRYNRTFRGRLAEGRVVEVWL